MMQVSVHCLDLMAPGQTYFFACDLTGFLKKKKSYVLFLCVLTTIFGSLGSHVTYKASLGLGCHLRIWKRGGKVPASRSFEKAQYYLMGKDKLDCSVLLCL